MVVTFEVAVKPEHRTDIARFVILHQRRGSAAACERYRDWRRSTGFMDRIRPWLAKPPAGYVDESRQVHPWQHRSGVRAAAASAANGWRRPQGFANKFAPTGSLVSTSK